MIERKTLLSESFAVTPPRMVTSGDETFTHGLYNSIHVLWRDSDGFINAIKSCQQFERDFRQFTRSKVWKRFLVRFQEVEGYFVNSHGNIYELKAGHIQEVYG